MIVKIILFLLIDIGSKIIVSRLVNINDSYVVINNFFNITYVRNTGAAWSIMAGKTDLLVIISLIIILGLGFYLKKHKPCGNLEKYGYVLVFGGALGNFLERLFLGYVTDFLDFNIFGYNYPIFNLADSFIFVGIVLLLIDTWRYKR